MKTKVALFKSVRYGFESVLERPIEGYVRASEWLEIELIELKEADRIIEEVKAIDEAIAEIREAAIRNISPLEERKQKLLALTHEESA